MCVGGGGLLAVRGVLRRGLLAVRGVWGVEGLLAVRGVWRVGGVTGR